MMVVAQISINQSIYLFCASKQKIHQYVYVTKKFSKAQEGSETGLLVNYLPLNSGTKKIFFFYQKTQQYTYKNTVHLEKQ